MSTVAARSFKERFPDSHLTLGINQRFKDLAPLFHDHPYYDAVHLYETYDGWPGERDRAYLEKARYDYVFSAMPQHRDQKWWTLRHQYAETVHMTGLDVPTDICPRLTRWFSPANIQFPTVAFAPFGGNAQVNDKMLSIAQAQCIVDHIVSLGYMVLHLGAPGEPRLKGAQLLPVSYFDSVRNMLSCKALIHCDTGMGHVAGAYNHLSLGLYGYRYFGKEFAHQIMPIHPNFRSVVAETIEKLDLEEIFDRIGVILGRDENYPSHAQINCPSLSGR